MRRLLGLADGVDAISHRVGQLAAGCTLLMVLIGAFNALARYLDRDLGTSLSSNRWLELQWYLFSAVFLLGASHTLRTEGHVRVDVFHSRFGRRTRTWIDILGSLLLLLPFCAFGVWSSIGFAARSWRVRESSPDPDGLARWPIKMLITLGFGLLFVQGIALVVRRIDCLQRGVDPFDETASRDVAEARL